MILPTYQELQTAYIAYKDKRSLWLFLWELVFGEKETITAVTNVLATNAGNLKAIMTYSDIAKLMDIGLGDENFEALFPCLFLNMGAKFYANILQQHNLLTDPNLLQACFEDLNRTVSYMSMNYTQLMTNLSLLNNSNNQLLNAATIRLLIKHRKIFDCEEAHSFIRVNMTKEQLNFVFDVCELYSHDIAAARCELRKFTGSRHSQLIDKTPSRLSFQQTDIRVGKRLVGNVSQPSVKENFVPVILTEPSEVQIPREETFTISEVQMSSRQSPSLRS